MPNTRANASAQRRSPRGSASRENGDEHENFNTPSHRAARAAANMSEQEYATLHRHPDEEYIAENLAKRIEEERDIHTRCSDGNRFRSRRAFLS